jgi:hypothetical protein
MATTDDLINSWPGVPSWLNIEALRVDRAAIQDLVKEGRAMEQLVEDYARRVFQVRCPTRLLPEGEVLPDETFELVERLSGSEALYDVVDDLALTLKAAIDHQADKVIAERPQWAPAPEAQVA